jgi:hypothetical protein
MMIINNPSSISVDLAGHVIDDRVDGEQIGDLVDVGVFRELR